MFKALVIFLIAIVLGITTITDGYTLQLSGGVEKLSKMASQVTDGDSPISGAEVSIPSYDFDTTTSSSGRFEIPKNFVPPYILTVKKAGYDPFSLTITSTNKPFKIELTKNSQNKLIIEDNTYHIGDDSFSENSANARDFRMQSIGVEYTKHFFVKQIPSNQNIFLKIGSIIGLDTKEAKRLGQNKVSFAYSSPAQVLINSKAIGKLKINGDNQKIKIPSHVLLPNTENSITIISGTNQKQSDEDYDDFEFSNIILEYN